MQTSVSYHVKINGPILTSAQTEYVQPTLYPYHSDSINQTLHTLDLSADHTSRDGLNDWSPHHFIFEKTHKI